MSNRFYFTPDFKFLNVKTKRNDEEPSESSSIVEKWLEIVRKKYSPREKTKKLIT